MLTSRFWAIKNATPEPTAILTEIKSEKFVETNKVRVTPIKKPIYTIFCAIFYESCADFCRFFWCNE